MFSIDVSTGLLAFGVLSILISCNSKFEHSVQLDNFQKKEYLYSDLPEEVRFLYNEMININNLTERDTLVIINSKLNARLINIDLTSDEYLIQNDGFNHVFFVGDSLALKLSANKGDPFVIYGTTLFYSQDLNLRISQLNNSKFIAIDLQPIFD